MSTPKTQINWKDTEEQALREVGVPRGSGLGRFLIGQRRINANFVKAIRLITEADPNNPKLQQAAKLVAEVPGRIPPGCSDPG
jgi:hypothetical protein